ncbi:hypothetical protein [Rouxiella chamberiensis]|uniref:hypothetical protein n=1 Tax=Rouxiella chamberiensis TaxID=1513468 RepID=UPI0005D3C104|nr:hypothetical protein [Rouxiella chamberiensis]
MNNLLLDAKVNPTLNPDPIPVALQVGFDLAAVMHLKRLDAGGNRAVRLARPPIKATREDSSNGKRYSSNLVSSNMPDPFRKISDFHSGNSTPNPNVNPESFTRKNFSLPLFLSNMTKNVNIIPGKVQDIISDNLFLMPKSIYP